MNWVCPNKNCYKIVVKDIEKFLRENPEINEIQCPYCLKIWRIRWEE